MIVESLAYNYVRFVTAPRYEHVQTLIGVLQQQRYAHTSINAVLSAIRGTVRAAMGMHLMTADDYQRIMLVKMVSGVRLPTGRMMGQGEIKALVDTCLNDHLKVKNKTDNSSPRQSPAAYRDLAILGLMYIGGLRRSEVADLDVEDIDLQLKEARIIGKGNKERMLFLDDGTVTAVKQWLDLRGDFDGALFYRVLKNGKIQAGRLSDQAIYNVVKNASQRLEYLRFPRMILERLLSLLFWKKLAILEWPRCLLVIVTLKQQPIMIVVR